MVARSVVITTVGVLVTVGVIAAAMTMTNVLVPHDRRNSPAAGARHMGSAVVSVDGLVCSACAQRLHEQLTKLPGVKTAHVDLARRAASVTFDDRAKTSDRDIRAAVEAAGFRPLGVEWGQDLSFSPAIAQLVIHGTRGPRCAAKLQRTLDGRPGVKPASPVRG